MSSFKLNVSIFAYDCVHSKTNNFYNNLILKLVLGLIGDFHNNPTNTNDQTWENSRSLSILAPWLSFNYYILQTMAKISNVKKNNNNDL
jgi:hypothetical protein